MAFSEDPRAALRQSILDQRESLSKAEATFRSETACANFLKFAEKTWKPKDFADRVVALYSVSRDHGKGELNPADLRKSELFETAHFAYPRIFSRADGRMEFFVPVHETDWEVGVYGIPEPRKELPLVEPKEIGLFIVPGVVFGKNGERIGRGAGFYDRYLKRNPEAFRVALAYDFQIVDQPIPENPWDQKVDWVIGETRACFPPTRT